MKLMIDMTMHSITDYGLSPVFSVTSGGFYPK